MGEHFPVLLQECLAWLAPEPGGRFIDGTVNGGGHSAAILEATAPTGTLLGLDTDPDALVLARQRLAPFGSRARLIHANFRSLGSVARDAGFQNVDGILLDLGLSSTQIEHSGRGFSFRLNEPLDMRFDPTWGVTAAEVLSSTPSGQLEQVIRTYGEEPRARAIVAGIESARRSEPIGTTGQLVAIIERAVGRRTGRLHPATRTFQALRIAVNDELNALAETLPQAVALLRHGGRLAVISFHSLEDRIVKGFFRSAAAPDTGSQRTRLPLAPQSAGPELRILARRIIPASPQEVARNPRSRSARLRVVERV